MEIKLSVSQSLELPGVYQILNKNTHKSYIGSTSQTIIKRMNHHLCMLRVGKHKNTYLQHSWNKHGEDSFLFVVLENTSKQNTLDKEQQYINEIGFDNLYNINPLATGTPNLSRETIDKRSNTFKLTICAAMEYYYKIKDNLCTLEDVPDKYKKIVESKLNHVIWNKGKTYSSGTDYSYLKGVRKKISDKVLTSRYNIKEHTRTNICPKIYVYNLYYEFLGEYRSSIDLEELSLQENFELSKHMVLKNPKGRNGHSPFILKSSNIQKSCKNNLQYKGLYFLTVPLYQVTDNETQGEFRESPEVDNTEPSQV